MDKKVYELICDGFKDGIQRDRALKFIAKEATPEEKKKFLINYLIRLKLELKKCLKYVEDYRVLIDSYNEKKFKSDEDEKDKTKNFNKYNKLAKLYQEKSDIYIEHIKNTGKFVFYALQQCKDLFTDHEIAQICSCSFNKVKKVHKVYDQYRESGHVDNDFLLSAVYLWGIEYRADYRGRKKGIRDCEIYEIPFYSAISYFIFDEVLKDKLLIDEYLVE